MPTQRSACSPGRAQGESRYVCCAAVNNIMEARRSPDYRTVMDQADLVTSDGMPLVWMLRWLGARSATRVYGPDLMSHLLEAAERCRHPGGILRRHARRCWAPGALRQAAVSAGWRWRTPRLRRSGELTAEEDRRTTQAIQDAGVRILFVGLGSPKQDRWMHAHKDRVPAVMLGVGAAFDFLAGAKPQAPRWMQSSGLEWAFRLASEPRRLWRRYLTQNPKFVVLALAQLLDEPWRLMSSTT